ncbi:hypothetical protein WNY37_09630 [Henriciella sp. AS95]|uniref:hypothetical protein n=1 Tax=Henriciella sp. AS95 TaxID=3135782 RepID=UPI003171CC19
MAEPGKVETSVETNQFAAISIGNDEANRLRLDIRPDFEIDLSSGWRGDLSLRLESAHAMVGLGSLQTYDEASHPLELGDSTRIEIDQATLSWRKRSTRVTLGKQTLAWGVLDGLQVTDRFDAVRRREAVFIDQRPDRMSRWGARAQFKHAGTRWDIAGVLDGTADQFAIPGDTYAVRAPRYRAGLPAAASLPDLHVKLSDEPTLGVKASRRFGANDASFLIIHGPDTEPVFRASTTGVALEYDSRTLVGATWQRSSGPRVWRLEAASISDQPVNLQSATPTTDDRQRWLVGLGVDWDLPDGLFANAQLGVDHITGPDLVRPSTDVVATLKLQKTLSNDTLRLGAELLASLNEGDGTFRPSISWRATDKVRLDAGLDLVWGEADGIFGQYAETDRVWIKTTFSLS